MNAPAADAARPAVIPTRIGIVTRPHICPRAGAPLRPVAHRSGHGRRVLGGGRGRPGDAVRPEAFRGVA